MGAQKPTAAFDAVSLDVTLIPPDRVFGRIYRQAFPDPLGYGKTPSRFSDPSRRVDANRFGVLYLGSLEAVLRDSRDGEVGDYPMSEAELDTRNYAEVEVRDALRLIDLTGDGPVRMGIPTDVIRASNQAPARAWSAAIYRHPDIVDGIFYPSRLNGETNLAIYDRAIPKLVVRSDKPFRRAKGLATVLDTFKVALI